ncbi:hypothetical protein NDI76_19405 [Halogeometricum sp. S1BR25-6]|uniref:Uncharacterized protein n=1 Tax=Halogeometricum salsisoli TaxID=2950536 RepID=A0ABU2GJA1_9EURY|nr:hypothetical protein [Halogeometricum sp. S1BR25-6]MDS0300918.1 hypothetical protein [Halogeometricum sp. S1BR25-6]
MSLLQLSSSEISLLSLAISVIGVGISLAVLAVGIWNLYLSHYQTTRSEVSLLPEEGGEFGFRGGNHAIDERAMWKGPLTLMMTNAGEKGGYVSSEEFVIVGLKNGDEIVEPGPISVEQPKSSNKMVGTEIGPGQTTRFLIPLHLKTETDIGPLVEHEFAIIEYAITVEDGQGSYEVREKVDALIPGPTPTIEAWEQHVDEHQNE